MNKITNVPVQWAYAGLALLFLLLFYRPVGSGDIWFLLLMGQYVLDHGHVPHQEFFLYSSMGAPQVFGGWGFGTLAELCRRVMGLPGVGIFNAVLWTTTFITALITARVRCAVPQSTPMRYPELMGTLIACMLIMYAVMPRSWFRPEVTMYLIWGIGAYLFESGRRAGNYKHALLLYPLLSWLESFLHTAGIILPLLLLGYLAEKMHDDYLHKRLPFKLIIHNSLSWLFALFASIALPILNPNGLDQNYLHAKLFIYNALHTLQIVQLSQNELDLMHSLVPTSKLGEFLPAWDVPGLIEYYMLLGALSILVLIMDKQRRLLNICHILPLAAVAILHNRGLGLWALALFVPLVEFSTQIAQMISKSIQEDVSTIVKAPPLCMLLLMIALLAHKNGTLQNVLAYPPLPEGASVIHARFPQGGNVFTSHFMGAETHAALGKNFPVSFAAHVMFLDPNGLRHFNMITNANDKWEKELERYQVIAIVSEPVNVITGDVLHPLLDIVGSKTWELVAIDEQAITFVRRNADAPPNNSDLRHENEKYWRAVHERLMQFGSLATPLVRKSQALAAQQLKISADQGISTEAALQQLHANIQLFPKITR